MIDLKKHGHFNLALFTKTTVQILLSATKLSYPYATLPGLYLPQVGGIEAKTGGRMRNSSTLRKVRLGFPLDKGE